MLEQVAAAGLLVTVHVDADDVERTTFETRANRHGPTLCADIEAARAHLKTHGLQAGVQDGGANRSFR